MQQCPKSLVDEEAWWLVELWTDWKQLGLLYDDGPMGEQPAWFVDLLRVAETNWSEAVEERRQREVERIRKEREG